MIKIKNVVKFIFILIAILLIVVWFQFFHDNFFDESNEKKANVYVNNRIMNNYATEENKKNTDNKDMAISVGEAMYIKMANFNFEFGDFNVEQGATEVLNIEELKEFATGNAFENFIKDYGIEKDDNGKYWDIGDRGSDIMYLNHHEMEIKRATDEKIEFTIIEYYAKNADDINIGYQNLTSDQIEMRRNKFTIIRENNAWKVSEYTNPK